MTAVRFPRLLAVAAALGAACTTPAHNVRDDVRRVAARAGTCESFAVFDGDCRAVHLELLARGATAELMQLDAQLRVARHTCAERALSRLVTNRAARQQDELDAMARSLDESSFRALVLKAFGNDPQVLARVEMAVATVAAERLAARQARTDLEALSAPKPQVPDVPPALAAADTDTDAAQARQCESRVPEEGVTCLGALVERGVRGEALLSSVQVLAARLVGETKDLAPERRAPRFDVFLGKLSAIPGARPPEVVMRELRVVFVQLWPRALALRREERFEHAAWLTKPFLRLPDVAPRVTDLQMQAVAHQDEWVARASGYPLAAALHRQVMASFTPLDVPPLALEPGHWDTARWVCARPLPKLKPPPGGMLLRVIARCTHEEAKPQPPTAAAMKTSGLEDELTWERVEGDVLATCGGETRRYPVSVREVLLDQGASSLAEEGGATGPGQALKVQLETILGQATESCRAAAERELPWACGRLGADETLLNEQRFVSLALRFGAWPPCFESWFVMRWGVPLPPLLTGPAAAPPAR